MRSCSLAAAQVFLILEYVDGGPSQTLDAEGKPRLLPERTVWSHLRHLVMGLEYLHMNGIVHRDIKPDNLLVTRQGKMYQGDAVSGVAWGVRPEGVPGPLASAPCFARPRA